MCVTMGRWGQPRCRDAGGARKRHSVPSVLPSPTETGPQMDMHAWTCTRDAGGTPQATHGAERFDPPDRDGTQMDMQGTSREPARNQQGTSSENRNAVNTGNAVDLQNATPHARPTGEMRLHGTGARHGASTARRINDPNLPTQRVGARPAQWRRSWRAMHGTAHPESPASSPSGRGRVQPQRAAQLASNARHGTSTDPNADGCPHPGGGRPVNTPRGGVAGLWVC